MSSPAPFNWSSLINPAVALGSKVASNALVPDPNVLTANTNAKNTAFGQAATVNQLQNQQANTGFGQQLALNQLGKQQQVRQNVLPGMYQTLGYSPTDAASKAASYGSTAPLPTSVPTPAALPTPTLGGASSSGPSGLATAGKVALGFAPAVIAGLTHAGAAAGGAAAGGAAAGGAAAGGAAAGGAATGGLGATIAGLATNPITIAAAAALVGGLLWRQSQAHPTADKWVQGEQNPFDKSMAAIDQSVASGQMNAAQAAVAKKANVQNYLASLNDFSSQGGKQKLVANQAMATFRQYYGDPSQYA